MSQSRRISESQPTPPEAAGRGRGRGRGRGAGGPGRGAPSVPSARSPAPAPDPAAGASSSSARPAAPAPASAPVQALTSEVERLALQPPPASSKAVRFPGRPGYGTVGTKIQVRANHFLVEVADRDWHHYDVAITPEVLSKGVNRALIKQLVKMYQMTHLGNRLPTYDGMKGIYTAGPLPFQSQDFVIKLVDDEKRKGPPSSSASGSGSKKREREFKVTIRFASKPDLHHLQQFLRSRQLDNPQETIQALDIALRASPSEKYNISGRSFFSPQLGNTGPLGSGTEYWRGYYQSLRPTQMGLSLNIDVSARAYYEPILVTEFIAKFLNCNLSRPLSDRDRLKIKKALRGIKVAITQNGRSYKVSGLSREPLGELTFTLDDKKTKTSVVKYFREKYQTELKFLSLPAIQAGSDSKPAYLPMEVCRIADGQRYSKRLNEGQVQALLKANCQRPKERENYIRQMVRQNNFNTDKYTSEFGIKVKEELALLDARVLPPPMLKYHDTGKEKMVNPLCGQWNMINKKMYSGGTLAYWTCLNFSTKRDLPFHFSKGLIDMCTSKGMRVNPNPLVPITSAPPHQIEKALMNVHEQSKAKLASMKQEGKLQLLIIILPDVKGSYGKIKRICETDLGIVSQCVQPSKAYKMQIQYLENVALKMNVKVGGQNAVLNDAAQRRIPLVSDRPTLILGADVTHPQPGEESSPSIAAVVGSIDWPMVTQYRGIVSAQKQREELIQDLYKTYQDPNRGLVHGGMIRELLMAFYRSTRQKPDRIIFYRDGVSEGQFSQVLLHELDAIRKACVSLEENYLPRVTFVVVQKRHHTRLFPVDHGSRSQTDRSGNILPGTVVDTKICHPREHDFYLNSHAGIQGTSRPSHYHVLYDENNFTADMLQTLTNNLCYTYARCTRSVSIVPPAYYAHLAAFRARSYIEGEIEGGDSASRGDSGSRSTNVLVTLPGIKDNVKDVMFYC